MSYNLKFAWIRCSSTAKIFIREKLSDFFSFFLHIQKTPDNENCCNFTSGLHHKQLHGFYDMAIVALRRRRCPGGSSL